jgi:hypothetical protein
MCVVVTMGPHARAEHAKAATAATAVTAAANGADITTAGAAGVIAPYQTNSVQCRS